MENIFDVVEKLYPLVLALAIQYLLLQAFSLAQVWHTLNNTMREKSSWVNVIFVLAEIVIIAIIASLVVLFFSIV